MAEYIFSGQGERRREETKRLARVLRIANLLTREPNSWKRAGLATHFEANERSIDRDLELLRNLGYEIKRSPEGYAFVRTPALPPVVLSMQEALALTLAAGLARDSGDVDTASLGTALAQLEMLMPSSARPLIRQELLQREANARVTERRRAALAVMQHALLEHRRVRIIYETAMRGGARSERVVEPYHLQRYGRFWIVVAYDHRRGAVRDFKIDRIQGAVLLDERYTIPDDFDLAAYRGEAWGLLRGEAGDPVEVELLFSAQAGRWVQEEDWGVLLTVEPGPGGQVLVRLRVGVTDEMLHWILGYGPECRVLAPDSLRQQVRAMIKAMAGLYGEEGQDSV